MTDVSCSLCSGNLRVFAQSEDPARVHGGIYSCLYCARCGLGQTHPQTTSNEVDYQTSYYFDQNRQPPWLRLCYQHFYAKRLALALKYKPGSGITLLDYGSGNGGFLRFAKERGIAAWGYDFSAHSHAVLEALGIPVFSPLFHNNATDTAVRKYFDIITLWHVLEHIQDPQVLLCELASYLTPTGILLVSVPALDSFQARLYKQHWFHLDMPRHRWHFTQRGLEKLLQAAGWSVVFHTDSLVEYEGSGALQSALNARGNPPNALYYQLKATEEKMRTIFPWKLIPAAAEALLATGFARALRHGASHTVIAVKNVRNRRT